MKNKANVRTIDIDKGRKRILNDLDELKSAYVTIGVHENADPYPKGQSVAFVATENEFGNTKIPQRSFLRSTFDSNREQWKRDHRDLLNDVILGKKDVKHALRILGFNMANEVQTTIIKLRTPPNAPSTIKAKPSVGDNPLIHTRRLLGSIGFQVHLPKKGFKSNVTTGPQS